MKSQIVHTKPPLTTYPRLRIGKNGDVVLFTDSFTGTVVYSATKGNPVGLHTDEWAIDHFSDFHGSITLENG